MKYFSIKLFTAVYAIILVVNFLWFISGSSALETESPLRIVLGSLLIFLLPGLVWGEILGLRSSHILETIALSFALTLTIEIILLPIPFLFGAKIWLWVALLFFICVLGIFFLNLKLKNGKEPEFINPLFTLFKQSAPLSVSTPLILVILVLISYGTYRWGEDLITIGGEKLLHMIFVRYYYSMPMVLNDLSLNQGVPPPNLIYLWEYLIAGWAFLINMDPLPLFYHARFVIPILGFSGMYLLIRNIFQNATKSEIIFWGVLIMCAGWFAFLSPSPLDWVKERDPFRGVMSFMGTVHHADAAMDILIALIAGLILLTLRRSCWKHIFLLAGILVASFMWHPREFFQSAIYVGIFGVTIFLPTRVSRKTMLKKWLIVMVVFLSVAVFFYSISSVILPKQSCAYDEHKIREVSLKYAFLPENLTGVRNLFNFPFHMRLVSSKAPDVILTREQLSYFFTHDWNYFLWLILSALAILLLAIYGDKQERRLSLFFVALWFLALGWNFSMLILKALTYSEIFMSTPRMVYIFPYIIIGAAISLVFQLFSKKNTCYMNLFVPIALMFGIGLLVRLWWDSGIPFIRVVSIGLSFVVLASFVLLLLPRVISLNFPKTQPFLGPVLGMVLFFVPILQKDYAEIIPRIVTEGRVPVKWFSDKNPFGFSKELICFIRMLPPKQNFLVDPLGKALVPVYAPHYIAVVPRKSVRTVISARKTYREVRKGRHPLFNLKNDSIDHKAIKDWLSNHAVDYILIEKKYYPKLLPYFRKFKKDFAITFNNQKKSELVVHYFGKDDQSL